MTMCVKNSAKEVIGETKSSRPKNKETWDKKYKKYVCTKEISFVHTITKLDAKFKLSMLSGSGLSF